MIEQFLTLANTPRKPTIPNVIFNFTPESLSDTSGFGLKYTTDLTGVVRVLTPTINDKPTTRVGTSTGRYDIKFTDKKFNLYTDSITLEWSNYINPNIGTYYINELLFSAGGSFSGAWYLRYENNGQGVLWTNVMTTVPGWTKASVLNNIRFYAAVFKDGKCSFYIDGVRKIENLTIPLGFPNSQAINQINLGYGGSTSLEATIGNRGTVRISDVAKYTEPTYVLEPY